MRRVFLFLSLMLLLSFGCGDGTWAYQTFVRGDANFDGRIDITDAVFIGDFLAGNKKVFCLDALDVDDNGVINAEDALYLSRYLFTGGPRPFVPFPGPGLDLTKDNLWC